MFVELTLELRTFEDFGDSRSGFWLHFNEIERSGADDRKPSLQPGEAEEQFRSSFPFILQNLLNEEIQRAQSSRRARTIGVRLISIEYGSLKPILEVTGIDSVALRDFVLSLLTAYSPLAFRRSMDARNVGLSASVRFLGDGLRTEEGEANRSTSAFSALGQAWMISNTSLIVPVGLALAVCYFGYSALNHELDASRAQAGLVQTERTEIVKALQAQNAKLSELVAAHPANNDNYRALTEILLALAKTSPDRSLASQAKSSTQPNPGQ
jgi:hypothetical protein